MPLLDGYDRHKATDAAIRDPRPGDRYAEMYSFDLFVIHVECDAVVTLECTRGDGVIMPRDGEMRIQSKEEFRKRLSYSSGKGYYWVSLVQRDFNVEGWHEFAIANNDLILA